VANVVRITCRAGLARPWLVTNYRSAANLEAVSDVPASALPGA